MLGVMPTGKAMEAAREAGLDLVEVAPNERPPVCKIMDFGKFKYSQKKRASQAEAAPGPGQGDPRPPQDRRPRHRGQGQAGPRVPRAQGQGAGQRPVPRPRAGAHRRRPQGHERGAPGPRGRRQGREEPVDGRQADDGDRRPARLTVESDRDRARGRGDRDASRRAAIFRDLPLAGGGRGCAKLLDSADPGGHRSAAGPARRPARTDPLRSRSELRSRTEGRSAHAQAEDAQGIKKRFKVSATGKVSHKHCGSSHLMSHKSGKQVRRLRKKSFLTVSAEAHRVRRALQKRSRPQPDAIEAAKLAALEAEPRRRPRPSGPTPRRPDRPEPRRAATASAAGDGPSRAPLFDPLRHRTAGASPDRALIARTRDLERCVQRKARPATRRRSGCSRRSKGSSAAVAACSNRPRRPCSAPACSPSATAGPRSATSASSSSSASRAAAEMRGLRYSRLIHGLHLAKIGLDRKSLSELAIHDPETFDAIIARVRAELDKADAAVAARGRPRRPEPQTSERDAGRVSTPAPPDPGHARRRPSVRMSPCPTPDHPARRPSPTSTPSKPPASPPSARRPTPTAVEAARIEFLGQKQGRVKAAQERLKSPRTGRQAGLRPAVQRRQAGARSRLRIGQGPRRPARAAGRRRHRRDPARARRPEARPSPPPDPDGRRADRPLRPVRLRRGARAGGRGPSGTTSTP